MSTMGDFANIPVRRKTKELLEAAKRGGESFDAVIRRTLDEAAAANELAFLREVNALLRDRKTMKKLR